MSGAEQYYAELGRKLFTGEWAFEWAAASQAQLPPSDKLEIAFAGRSNVGKSSLLNALTNRKSLARTSQKPGRTRELNFFAVNGLNAPAALRLVDMPGYGYAAVGRERSAAWGGLIEEFLRGRAGLARIFLLVDGRHGLKESDLKMLDRLDRSAVSYQLILTKKDEVKACAKEAALAAAQTFMAKRPAAFPEVMFTSAHTEEGLSELRASIAKLVAEHGAWNPAGVLRREGR
ncbi:MAG TPA: ribosome biogenesis GTP-binding protein YihA/YsxC [Methylocella sp.]|nr:ribosome biogenesis GTP-binding protein YihA/YsxC [Methylocella sp.]